jgi:hypothetical protein
MAKIAEKRRHFQIVQKQQRRRKLRKLKEQYAAAKGAAEKERIARKAEKIAPHVNAQEYLAAKQ